MDFVVLGGANYTTYDTGSANTQINNKFNYGVGAGAILSLAPRIGFEIDGIYRKNSFGFEFSGAESTTTMTALIVPAMLRVNLPVISLGAGGYYSMGLGDLSQTVTFNGNTTTSSSTYEASSLEKSDYGLAASVRMSVLPLGVGSVFIDGRYLMGMKDRAVGAGEMKTRSFEAMLGLSF